MPAPFFLTLVTVVQNRAGELRSIAERMLAAARSGASEFELVIVDNGSTDESVEVLRELTGASGIPNLQIYVLTSTVDVDTAQLVGVENAIGDFVATVDLDRDDLAFLPTMIDEARGGKDVVFAENTRKARTSLLHRIGSWLFYRLYSAIHRIHLGKEAPRFRILSRRVVNFVLQHDSANVFLRLTPLTAGFDRVRLTYASAFDPVDRRPLLESVESGIRLLATGSAPMRLASFLCLFGAGANIVYSIYVVVVYLFKPNVTAGWATLSLQQSGMFFLISLVLLVLSEYVLQISRTTTKRPMYAVNREMTSTVITRREKINVVEVA